VAVEWRDPPATRSERWEDRLAPVKERPGDWAMVWQYGKSDGARCAVRRLRNGRLRTPPGLWEFAVRGREVFAKYLGETA
jgi:hypothetical protein